MALKSIGVARVQLTAARTVRTLSGTVPKEIPMSRAWGMAIAVALTGCGGSDFASRGDGAGGAAVAIAEASPGGGGATASGGAAVQESGNGGATVVTGAGGEMLHAAETGGAASGGQPGAGGTGGAAVIASAGGAPEADAGSPIVPFTGPDGSPWLCSFWQSPDGPDLWRCTCGHDSTDFRTNSCKGADCSRNHCPMNGSYCCAHHPLGCACDSPIQASACTDATLTCP